MNPGSSWNSGGNSSSTSHQQIPNSGQTKVSTSLSGSTSTSMSSLNSQTSEPSSQAPTTNSAATAAAPDSHLSSYIDNVNLSLISTVLTPLSNWLSTNPKDTSVSSMLSILRIPIPSKLFPTGPAGPTPTPTQHSSVHQSNNIGQVGHYPPPNSSMNITNFLKTVGTISPAGEKKRAPTKAKPPTKSKKIEPSTDSASKPCIYQYQRGNHPGEYCGRPTVNGTDYCKICIKKKGVENQLNKTSTMPTTSSVQTVMTPPLGVTVVPNTMISNNPPKSTQEPPELDVEEIPDRPGYYLEQTYKFIIHQLPDETAVALKVKEGNSERDLTDKEKDFANKMGLATVCEAEDGVEVGEEDKDDGSQVGDDSDSEVGDQDEVGVGGGKSLHPTPLIPKIPMIPKIPVISRK